jgi:tetratricopeptide (TPR) repeat protein
VVALVVLPVVYLSALGHELGHALLGRCVGYAVTSFGLGLGRPFLVRPLGNTRFYLARTKPLQGVTFMLAPGRPPARWRKVAMLAGGVLANALLGTAALGLLYLLPAGRAVWWTVLAVNGLLVIGSLAPTVDGIGVLGIPSDGSQIFEALRGRARPVPLPKLIEHVQKLRGLWQDIGDYPSLYYHLMSAVMAWEELGEVEHAQKLCDEAEALRPAGWPGLRAWGALARAAVAARAGSFAAGATALDEAEAVYRAQELEAGLFLAAWGRARLLREQGDAAGALRLLESLAAGPLPAGAQEVCAIGLLACRLCARAEQDDTPGAEALRGDYEAAPLRLSSAARHVRVYRALGRMYVRRGAWAEADAAYHKALQAAGKLHAMFTSPAEQARYARAEEGLLAEARDCQERLGRGPEDRFLRDIFPARDEIERQREVELRQRGRRRRRLAWGAVFVNAAVLAGLATFLHFRGPVSDGWPGDLGPPVRTAATLGDQLRQLSSRMRAHLGPLGAVLLLSLALWTALALVPLLFPPLIGRLFAALRYRGGFSAAVLAALPWLIWLFLYLLLKLYSPP